jgi:hypothetical protein
MSEAMKITLQPVGTVMIGDDGYFFIPHENFRPADGQQLYAESSPSAAKKFDWEENLAYDASSHLRIFGYHIDVFPVKCKSSGNTTHYDACYRMAESDDWNSIKRELPNRDAAKQYVEQWLLAGIAKIFPIPTETNAQKLKEAIQELCDRPQILNNANIVATDAPAVVVQKYRTSLIAAVQANKDEKDGD